MRVLTFTHSLKRVLSPHEFALSKVIMILFGFNTNIVSKSFAELARNRIVSRSMFSYTDEIGKELYNNFPVGRRIVKKGDEKSSTEATRDEKSDSTSSESIRNEKSDYYGSNNLSKGYNINPTIKKKFGVNNFDPTSKFTGSSRRGFHTIKILNIDKKILWKRY